MYFSSELFFLPLQNVVCLLWIAPDSGTRVPLKSRSWLQKYLSVPPTLYQDRSLLCCAAEPTAVNLAAAVAAATYFWEDIPPKVANMVYLFDRRMTTESSWTTSLHLLPFLAVTVFFLTVPSAWLLPSKHSIYNIFCVLHSLKQLQLLYAVQQSYIWTHGKSHQQD